jgi:hypothetical protein
MNAPFDPHGPAFGRPRPDQLVRRLSRLAWLNPEGYDLVVRLIADWTPDDDGGRCLVDDAPVEEWAEPLSGRLEGPDAPPTTH